MSVRKWAYISSPETKKPPVQCTSGVLSWVMKVTICFI